MKIEKENLSNFVFIVLLVLLIFTPVGFHTRVFVSKILAFSPSMLGSEEQVALSDYYWKLSSSNGETFDFRNLEGKVVLVNYWATWCPPCVAEMPSLQALYVDYGDEVTFIMVAHDALDKVQGYLNKNQYNFPVYFEKSGSPNKLFAESIPTTFIIDRQGKIVVKKIGAADWNSKTTRKLINQLLEE